MFSFVFHFINHNILESKKKKKEGDSALKTRVLHALFGSLCWGQVYDEGKKYWVSVTGPCTHILEARYKLWQWKRKYKKDGGEIHEST